MNRVARMLALAAVLLFAQFALALPVAHAGCDEMPATTMCVGHCAVHQQGIAPVSFEKHWDGIPAAGSAPQIALSAVRSAAALPRPVPRPPGRSLQVLYCSYQT